MSKTKNSNSKNPLNILIDARIIGTGTGNYAEGILDELQKLDKFNNYTVVLDAEAKWVPDAKAKNFKVYKSKNTDRKHTFFIRGNLNLAVELYKLKADIFWGTFQHIPFFYFKRNTLLTVHDLTQLRIANPKNKKERQEAWKNDKKAVIKDKLRKLPFSILPKSLLAWSLNFFGFKFSVWRAKHIFTPSNYVREDVIDYFKLKPQKVSVTVNGGVVLAEEVPPEPVAKLKGSEFLFYAGTDFAHKNLISVVEAMALAPLKAAQLKFVMIGVQDRNYLTILDRARELNLSERVLHLGYVSAANKVWLFQNAKAYIFPSLSEGFGIPALEAMAYGLPVVASNKTAIPEVCADGAIYFDPTDPQDISNQAYKLVTDSKLQKKLIAAGKKRNKFYNWNDSAKVVLESFKKVADD